jgi:hypothetical protein
MQLRIPYRFVRDRVRLSWREVRFGLENELLDPEVPVELAGDRVAEIADPSAALVELAGAGKNEPTLEIVEQLAQSEPEPPENEIRDKWLYLVLAWIYERRDEISDPLQRVEEVYADFDYPERIATFVRYMPMDGEDLGSREANERRLFERWKRYLDQAASVHAP